MKRILCILLLLALCVSMAACGGSPREVRTVATLVEQEYSLAFRTGDPTAYYVAAAIEVLNGAGKTTLMSAVAGLKKPSSGKVFLDRKSVV